MSDTIFSYGFYLFLITGLLIGFGFLFHLLVTNGWKKLSRTLGYAAFYPRFIGTPIHELGHLFFAFITGSKIRKVKLFPVIDKQTRSCGGAYVTFAPRANLLGSFSLFLSGIGPMLFCPLVIMILMYFLVPDLYLSVMGVISSVSVMEGNDVLQVIPQVLLKFFQSFQIEMIKDWHFWLFLVLAIPIANECVLSSADMKNAGKGFLVLVAIFIIAGFVFNYFPAACIAVVTQLERIASLLICVLCLALIFNILHWILATVIGRG